MPQIDLGQVVGAQGPQGIQGPQGAQGIQGPAGPAATINGVNALTIEAGANIDLAQEGGTATLSVPTDSTPTAGSTKPVQSGGVAEALNAKPNRNLLDNWYFMNPVNQRGVGGTISEAGYFIDRWKLVSGSVTLTSTGITINGTISQVLENAAGTNVTASALTTTGIVSVSYDNSSKTFTITGTGQTFVAAKLELGSVQTLARQDEDGNWVLNEVLDYGEELAKCKRYYRRVFLNYLRFAHLGRSIARVGIPTEGMRVQPSATILGTPVVYSTNNWATVDVTLSVNMEPILDTVKNSETYVATISAGGAASADITATNLVLEFNAEL